MELDTTIDCTELRFVDLFSGLGGFHIALSRLGHRCVFASEIDPYLRGLYFLNFGIKPSSDIRVSWEDVPPHDVLCAGFPCHSFSKAGSQLGFHCPNSGDLFKYILSVIDRHMPKFLLFENVPNILRHAKGQTWTKIKDNLEKRGYSVDFKELSPHQIGIPQIRYRVIIVASRGGLSDFNWPEQLPNDKKLHLSSVLDENLADADALPENYIRYLEVWQEFLDRIGNKVKMPSFPIWAMEFGADYPYEAQSPISYSSRYLARFRGAFGERLSGKLKGQQLAALPSYARTESGVFPNWKIRFIRQNREFFSLHCKRLKDWIPKVQVFSPSFQKFEWNWQAGNRNLWDKVIQFRSSGIRVKNPATAPSLVALTTSQVPVIAWERRYMTIRECARLQSLDKLIFLPQAKTRAFKALGNAVNSDVVYVVAKSLLARNQDEGTQNKRRQEAEVTFETALVA